MTELAIVVAASAGGQRLKAALTRGAPPSGWRVENVGTHAEVLRLLEAGPVAVIAVEMAHPPADSLGFLARLRTDHPAVARVVVCAESEGCDSVERVLSVDLSAEDAWAELQSATIQHRALRGERLLALTRKLSDLPALPKHFGQLLELLADTHSPIDRVVDVIETDPALTLKILQLANSAFFGRGRRIATIKQAAMHLGVTMLRSLVLSVQMAAMVQGRGVQGFSIEHFQAHSLRVARLARGFLRGHPKADEAFTLGLVHDVGKLVLAVAAPDLFAEVMRRTVETGERWLVAEQEVVGVTHPLLGAHLVAAWGLPHSLVSSIAHHHTLSTARPCPTLAAVHAADALLEIHTAGASPEVLDSAYLEKSGLLDRLPEWTAQALEEVERVLAGG